MSAVISHFQSPSLHLNEEIVKGHRLVRCDGLSVSLNTNEFIISTVPKVGTDAAEFFDGFGVDFTLGQNSVVWAPLL